MSMKGNGMWRALRGLAGVVVAAALCMTVTVPANGEDGDASDAMDGVASTAVAVRDADSFLKAVFPCTAGESKMIVIAGNIDLTAKNVEAYTSGVGFRNNMQCSLEIVSDGQAQREFTWSGDDGSLFWPSNSGSVTIGRTGDNKANMLKFTSKNSTAVTGPLFHNYGTLTIQGGEFSNLRADKGPVAYNDGTMTVTGGTFTGNISNVAQGGVFYQASGSTTITGGIFSNNYAYSANTRVGSSGGGVLHAAAGTVEVSGGTFESNHTNASAYMSGGGAFYVHGKLTVANAADGTKPVFKNNWATEDNKNPITFNNDGSFTGSSMRGGAGGAIFLQGFNTDTDANRSYGYFLGGEFEGNVSGYLGGAIYTEEYTVSYVGPAAATLNTAGHFGGGLWFCPSGVSEASKSGNIALLDNRTNSGFDSNTDNLTSKDSPTEAGSDLAIMNPYFKSKYGVHDNAFLLLNTWFTDRGTPTVDWYWDGQPRTTASGYADRLQQEGAQGNNGRDAVRAYKYDGSDQYDDETNPALNDGKYKGKYKRYTTPENSVKQESPTTIQQYWGKTGKDNTYGGIGLKAVLKEGANWDNAWNSAKVTFKLNGARLSGGAFGSNGRVILATPYSAAWNKVDAENHATKIANTSWRVSANTGNNTVSAANSDRLGYDAGCPVMKDRNPNDSSQNGCWMHRDGDAEGVVSIIVTDNGPRDNNPESGEFGIDNLSPGTGDAGMDYELREESVPAGYQKSNLVYTFTILPTQTAAPKIEVQGDEKNGAIAVFVGGCLPVRR